MSDLNDVLRTYVGDGTVPGAVGLVARGDQVEVRAVGSADVEGTAPVTRESIFRIASITKPIIAAAVMMLVEDGRIALDDPVAKWLPELAAPVVVRTQDAPVDDVVPAARPITVFDLLSSCAGYGFPDDFSLPAVELLFSVQPDGREPGAKPSPDQWMAELARVPLLRQPGEAFLYNTCSDLQGVLIARVAGQPLPEFLAERVFEPLGMIDTGFTVPAGKRDRFTSYYRNGDGGLELVDAPDGAWASRPEFPSGAGGLVCTVDDWLRFARMLLAGGGGLLSPGSVRLMTTDQLTQPQRDASRLFLEGQGWGFGGSVDVEAIDPWNVPGRYGWVGGTGTAAHITPSTGAVTILLSQLEMAGPTAPALMRDFWRYAANA
jgi:CubicO group peptidase (beta-lactamase class C family)